MTHTLFKPVQELAYADDALAAVDEAGLHHVILELPLRGSSTVLLPTLFLAEGNSIWLHNGAARWARAALGVYSLAEVRRHLRVLGQLYDFWVEAWERLPLRTNEHRTLIWSYLYARYRGTNHESWGDGVRSLGWRPLKYSTVRSEFKALERVVTFSRKSAPCLEAAEARLGERLIEDVKRKQRDFFIHLNAQRERWSQKFGRDGRMPNIGVRAVARSSHGPSLDRTPDSGEVDELIRRETHPMRKLIWVLLRYGGLRVSEALNMWQVDILPAGVARHVFSAPMNTITPVLAHPHESTYLGDLTRVGLTRQQYLERHYGLVPRPDMVGTARAGWKGCQMRNEHLSLASVFWLPGGAEACEDALSEVLDFHRLNRTSNNHPWLFVNLRSGPGFGEPMKAGKVRVALYRRFGLLGLEPSRNGRRVHGLRHRYKADLDALGLKPEHKQVCMRHASILSQEDYGLEAVAAQEALTRQSNQKGFK